MDRDALRGRTVIEESREAVVVLDDEDRVLAASRRARQALEGVREGEPLPEPLLRGEGGRTPLVVPYGIGGRTERLVYFSQAGDLAAYEELRSGFTAAVSHELRTPLARLLSLLELAGLPGEDVPALVEQARHEIDVIRELIDEVLFLAELESGTRVVSLGAEPVLPVLRGEGPTVPRVVDDGAGAEQSDLPRLFERFYRTDRSRGSRGTGLGLAIVKHVVSSAGGTVEAAGRRGRGLEIRCYFPLRA